MTTNNTEIPRPNFDNLKNNFKGTTKDLIDVGLIIAQVTYTKHLDRLKENREWELRKIWLDTGLVFVNDTWIYNVLTDGYTIPEGVDEDKLVEEVKTALNRFIDKIVEYNLEDRKQ